MGFLAYLTYFDEKRATLKLSRKKEVGHMADRKSNESKFMSAILKSVRKTAVRNAGIPSLKGSFEKKVPEELRK